MRYSDKKINRLKFKTNNKYEKHKHSKIKKQHINLIIFSVNNYLKIFLLYCQHE